MTDILLEPVFFVSSCCKVKLTNMSFTEILLGETKFIYFHFEYNNVLNLSTLFKSK